MKLHQYGVLGLSALLPLTALADFQYRETTQITGGSVLGLMKMAGAFSQQARQAGAPVVSTVYVQGNRMARVNAQTMEIIDLDKESITHVDLQKRTYTEMTFEQMRQQIEQAEERAKEQQAKETHTAPPPPPQQGGDNVEVKFKVDVRNTAATKDVSGLTTNESILTMQMEGTDTTNGQKGAFAITNDMWLAPEIPGYDEVREFNKRFAIKMGRIYSGIAPSMTAMHPGMGQGMSDLSKEVSKLKGIPIQQTLRMGATADGQPLPAASEAPLPPDSSGPQMPSGGQVAQQSASSVIASKLGGFGLGGFGHKKTQDPPANPPDNGSAGGNQTPTATVLMESQTEISSFGSSTIDPSKFMVPAGFKQVQPPSIK